MGGANNSRVDCIVNMYCNYTGITDSLETKTDPGLTQRKPLGLIRKWASALQNNKAGVERLKHLGFISTPHSENMAEVSETLNSTLLL